jgi:hypothetical protein
MYHVSLQGRNKLLLVNKHTVQLFTKESTACCLPAVIIGRGLNYRAGRQAQEKA